MSVTEYFIKRYYDENIYTFDEFPPCVLDMFLEIIVEENVFKFN